MVVPAQIEALMGGALFPALVEVISMEIGVGRDACEWSCGFR